MLNLIYATTLAAKSFRIVIVIAACFNLEIMQYNIVGVFLNALITLSNLVYCNMLDSFCKKSIVV